MTAGDKVRAEPISCLFAPRLYLILVCSRVVVTSKNGYGAFYWFLVDISICFDKRKVSSQYRQKNIHQFFIHEKLSGCAVVSSDAFYKIFAVLVSKWCVSVRKMGGAVTGNKKMNRKHTALTPENPTQFKSHQRAHAVTEKCKGPLIEMGCERYRQGSCQ